MRPSRPFLLLLTTAALLATGTLVSLRPVSAAAPTCPTEAPPTAVRLAGADRITTAIALAQDGWGVDGAPTVVLASARGYADALAATPWAAAHDAPLLLTEPTELPASVASTLEDLGAQRVVIVGGTDAVSEEVEAEVAASVPTVDRLAGDDRFGTAAAVSRDLHTSAPSAVVVTAWSFADAVASGPLVSRGGYAPILLTDADDLHATTAQTLQALGTTDVTVVGGPAVISDRVVAELEADGIQVQRVAGADRYATSVAVVDEAARRHGTTDTVAAVTGADYPDALGANTLAARRGATVLLVERHDLIDTPATTAALGARGAAWSCVLVVGGPAAVDERVAEQIVSFTGAPPPDGHPVLLSAGDIASCGLRTDDAVAALLDRLAGTVLTLGDNAYPDGTAQQYADCYHPSWGRHRVRTRAALGNHDIRTADGGPTYDYFGVRVGSRDQGWHAFDLGPDWRVLVVNSNCPGTVRCDADSAQYAWLRDQLQAAGDRHVVVAAHHPRWSSGAYAPGEMRVDPFWRLAAAHGADLWLAGHEHGYERFEPLDADGRPATTGVQEIIAGTGGASLRSFGAPVTGSQAQVVAHGVLELTLRPDGYAWRFVDLDGAVRDAGDRSLAP